MITLYCGGFILNDELINKHEVLIFSVQDVMFNDNVSKICFYHYKKVLLEDANVGQVNDNSLYEADVGQDFTIRVLEGYLKNVKHYYLDIKVDKVQVIFIEVICNFEVFVFDHRGDVNST